MQTIGKGTAEKVVRHAARPAMSFAFSGCGWLTPFHMGVVRTMKEEGLLTSESVVAGTSGGAIAALLAVNNVHPDEGLETIIRMSKDPDFKQNIDKGLKRILREVIPDNVLENSNGRLHVCVTKVWPNPSTKPLIQSQFASTEELLDNVAASCFLPLYSNRRTLFTYMGGSSSDLYMDGGVLARMPPIGDIKVAPFPRRFAARLATKVHISLDAKQYPLRRLVPYILNPAPEEILKDIYRQGTIAAEQWIWENREKL
jgi:hypothetical protein